MAQLLGGEPSQLIKEDLRRLKQMMEAGEIATIDGQTSGSARNEEAALATEDEISTQATQEIKK